MDFALSVARITGTALGDRLQNRPSQGACPLTSPAHTPTGRWHVAAAFAAWLLPGSGHYLVGQKQRGMILATAIGLLWLAGLLVGGITVFDRKDHPYWFAGQMLMAPSVVADGAHQWLRGKSLPEGPHPDKNPLFEPSFGRTQEQGVLFTTLAGLLNLLAVIDVLYRDSVQIRRDGLTP